MHKLTVNPLPLSLLSCALLVLILNGCEEHKPSPIASSAANSPSEESPSNADNLLGKWIGPEGTFLQLAGGDGKYEIIIQNLDGPRTFQGRAAGNQIEFERDGVKYSLHASTGLETGMKWLSEKSNCVMVSAGEGYCRD